MSSEPPLPPSANTHSLAQAVHFDQGSSAQPREGTAECEVRGEPAKPSSIPPAQWKVRDVCTSGSYLCGLCGEVNSQKKPALNMRMWSSMVNHLTVKRIEPTLFSPLS